MGKGAGEDPELIGQELVGNWAMQDAREWVKIDRSGDNWWHVPSNTTSLLDYDDCHNTIITYDYSWLKYTRVSKSIETKMFS